MRHLICNSVYSKVSGLEPMLVPGDGVELLTDYDPVPDDFKGSVSVHLPYAIDWYGRWSGKREISDDVKDELIKYIYYGRDREEIVSNVRKTIEIASTEHPPYGVMHACSANFDELYEYDYSEKDSDVVSAFTEMVNEAVSYFKNGKPPFTLAFENLWWPGLRLTDAEGFRYLERHLEFDDWGICLDTGHLLVALKGAKDEEEALEMLNRTVDRYPKDMLDRIIAMHLHVNTSKEYISSFKIPDGFYDKGHMGRYSSAYQHVTSMDQHLPFTNKGVKDLVERLSPDYVNHEMGAVDIKDRVEQYKIQRSLFL